MKRMRKAGSANWTSRAIAPVLCLTLTGVSTPTAAQIIPPSFLEQLTKTKPGLYFHTGGQAWVMSGCTKPMHSTTLHTNSFTATLQETWSDDCADGGSSAAAALEGEVGYNQLTAIVTTAYSDDEKHIVMPAATVTGSFVDALRFEIVGSAVGQKSCGVTITPDPLQPKNTLPTDWVCLPMRIYIRATFDVPNYDSIGAGFSGIYFYVGDLKIASGGEPIAVGWICNALDLCHGGAYHDTKTINVVIGTNPVNHTPITTTLSASVFATIVANTGTAPVHHTIEGDHMAGVYNVKVCVESAVPGSVRVISASGTDYSNATNHCHP